MQFPEHVLSSPSTTEGGSELMRRAHNYPPFIQRVPNFGLSYGSEGPVPGSPLSAIVARNIPQLRYS